MDRIELLRTFCAAAEATSFRAAAKRLGMSPQGITRAVKELEDTFGETLFHRNTRRVEITAFGDQMAKRAREALGSVDKLFLSGAQRSASALSGPVRVTAPGAVGRRFLLRALATVHQSHPQIALDIRLSEQLADVVGEKVDVGVRVGFVRSPGFVARAAGKVPFFIVASPRLLRRIGRPTQVKDFESLPVTALIDANTGRIWPWFFEGHQQFTPTAPAFVTDDPESECEAVMAGIGFGQIPGYLAIPHIRRGKLVPVLEGAAPPPWEIYVFRPQRAPVPARVRLIYDALLNALANPEIFPSTTA
jgi:DNA-binding transcriptional LysR family regulator